MEVVGEIHMGGNKIWRRSVVPLMVKTLLWFTIDCYEKLGNSVRKKRWCGRL